MGDGDMGERVIEVIHTEHDRGSEGGGISTRQRSFQFGAWGLNLFDVMIGQVTKIFP